MVVFSRAVNSSKAGSLSYFHITPPAGQFSVCVSGYESKTQDQQGVRCVTHGLTYRLDDMGDHRWKPLVFFFFFRLTTHIVHRRPAHGVLLRGSVCYSFSPLKQRWVWSPRVFAGPWIRSTHCSDVSEWRCNDFSLESSSSAIQSFYSALLLVQSHVI